MMGKLHEALVSAGVEEAKAREAAEEVANYDNPIAKIEADLLLLKCMVGAVLALELTQFARVFVQ